MKSKLSRVLPLGSRASPRRRWNRRRARSAIGQGGQQTWPAFTVGLGGELGPQRFDGGQAQFAEHQVERRGMREAGVLIACGAPVGRGGRANSLGPGSESRINSGENSPVTASPFR